MTEKVAIGSGGSPPSLKATDRQVEMTKRGKCGVGRNDREEDRYDNGSGQNDRGRGRHDKKGLNTNQHSVIPIDFLKRTNRGIP